MRRLGLAVILVLGANGAALAQTSSPGAAQITAPTNDPNNSVVQPGIAKPPAGVTTPPPPAQPQVGVPPNMANNPTLPQSALQPAATIGAKVPIAGPGGTTSMITGNNEQEFAITRWFKKLFN